MPKSRKAANRQDWRTDPNYRKASLLKTCLNEYIKKIFLQICKFKRISELLILRLVRKEKSLDYANKNLARISFYFLSFYNSRMCVCLLFKIILTAITINLHKIRRLQISNHMDLKAYNFDWLFVVSYIYVVMSYI